MITVKKDAIKYKDSEGNMQSAGVLANVGTFGDLTKYASIIQFNDSIEMPAKVVLNLWNATNLNSLSTNTKIEEITITLAKQCVSMDRMFYGTKANSLKKIVLNFDTSKVTSFRQAFCWIGTVGAEIIGELNFSSATNVTAPFSYSWGLTEVRFAKETLKLSLSIDACKLLSDESIQSIIDGLADLTGQTAQTITWHKEVYDKLTDEQKSQIVAKNWTLASA